MSDDTPPTRDLAAELDGVLKALATLSARVDTLTKRVADEVDGAAEGLAELRADIETGRKTAAVLKGHIEDVRDFTARTRGDLDETTHDLVAVSTLLGHQLGDPFRTRAKEIVTKRQTGGGTPS